MQSSSELFPVALISAEFCGDLSEDVYRLKPANSPDYSVELAVTRLGLARHPVDAPRGVPVILVHGSFSNRRFWYSPRGIGLGAHLARLGFDVWVAEMRGHGLSQRNQAWKHNRVADYARYDLPAIGAFVAEQSGQVPHWVGHSLGGTVIAGALGGGYLDASRVASAALFGSQVSRVRWPLKIPPVEWLGRFLLKRLSAIPGQRLKRGPEDEPVGIALESLRWHGLFGRFGVGKEDWWAGLKAVEVPLFAAAGAADEQDPAWACQALFEQFASPVRRFLELGRAQGLSHDYGHVDMLVSKGAQEEVWPLLVSWLNERIEAVGKEAKSVA